MHFRKAIFIEILMIIRIILLYANYPIFRNLSTSVNFKLINLKSNVLKFCNISIKLLFAIVLYFKSE